MIRDHRLAILLRDLAALDRRRAELQAALADELEGGAGEEVDESPAPPPAPPCKLVKPPGRRQAPLVTAPAAVPDDMTAARARKELPRLGFRRR